MSPKVSVIICTYKRPQLIKRAVQRVLDQTFKDFEIVIIDDSPDDETEKATKSFNDQRIKYTRNKVRRGFIACRNQAVRKSNPNSQYIAFLDDDDEWLPQFLEKTIKKLEERKDLGVVNTYAELRTGSGEKLPKVHGKLGEWWQSGIGNAHVMRKEIFTKDNIWYDENILAEDMDFGFRVLQKYKIESVPEVLYIYYFYPTVRGDTLSTSKTPETPSETIETFYKKNNRSFQKIGRKAFGWLCFFTGHEFCKAGKAREGRSYLLKSCLTYPHPRHILFYFTSLFFPSLFQNRRFLILKQRIFQGKI